MTTITFRDGILAADTLIAYNTIVNGERPKIALAGEYYVALAGSAFLRPALEAWVSAGCPKDAVPELLMEHATQFAAIILDKTGQPYEFDNGFLVPIYAPYTAIGSGALLALGAMAHGASAEEAVEAAARHDKNTGGRIDFFHFSTLTSDFAREANGRLN